MQLIGRTFRKRVEKHEIGTSKSLYQDWKVVSYLDDNTYNCVRVDSTEDPMYTANPHKRVFKAKDILKWINEK